MSDQEPSGRKSIGAKRSPATQEAILAAAEQLLIEKGDSGFSVEGVAKRARAGKATIYRWWPSRSALLLEVYHRLKRNVEYPDTGTLEEDLYRFLRSLLKQWDKTPSGDAFRSLIVQAQQNASARDALADYARDRRTQIGQMVERAIARGEARADVEPTVAADFITSYAWVHLLTGRTRESDKDVRRAVRLLIGGLLA